MNICEMFQSVGHTGNAKNVRETQTFPHHHQFQGILLRAWKREERGGVVNANFIIDLHLSVSVGMDWNTENSQETYGKHSCNLQVPRLKRTGVTQ